MDLRSHSTSHKTEPHHKPVVSEDLFTETPAFPPHRFHLGVLGALTRHKHGPAAAGTPLLAQKG